VSNAPASPSRLGLGWLPELEAHHASAIAALTKPLTVSAPPRSSIPAIFRPRIQPESQGAINSCSGNALATAGEIVHYIASKGQMRQFSRRASYTWAKQIDGSDPRTDAGATISGAALVANRIGFAPEELVPYYQGGYQPGIPNEQQAREAASPFRVRSITPIKSYADLDRFCTAGAGAVVFGIHWLTGWDGLRGRAELDQIPGGRSLGGHALATGTWITRNGERWYDIYNSHGTQWGSGGAILTAPHVLDYQIRNSPFGWMGISDMADVTPRPVSWTEVSFG
jgi:hypothetical protein